MGLHETQQLDLDEILFGDPGNDSSDVEEIICRCGHGRGRVAMRTVPRLPQAAILHRISLMEQHGNIPPTSSGVRRGRGRARILRDKAAAILPAVGKSKKQEELSVHHAPVLQTVEDSSKEELVSVSQKTTGTGNWLHDEFPTLAEACQDTDSDSSSKATKKGRRKPNFREIRDKIGRIRPEIQNDLEYASIHTNSAKEEQKQTEIFITEESRQEVDQTTLPAAKHGTEIAAVHKNAREQFDNVHINGAQHEIEIIGAYNKKEEHAQNGLGVSEMRNIEKPKINQKNFMKFSKIEFEKMLPEGMFNNNYNNNKRKYRNKNHYDNLGLRMDRFIFDDEDIPDYSKYEVTHEDIRRHNRKVEKVPDTVKDRVNDWLSKMDTIGDCKETSKFEESGERYAGTGSEFAAISLSGGSHESHENLIKDTQVDSFRPENKTPEGTETICINSEEIVWIKKSTHMVNSVGSFQSEIQKGEGLSVNNSESQLSDQTLIPVKKLESPMTKCDSSHDSNVADQYIASDSLADFNSENINSLEIKEPNISQVNNLNIDKDTDHDMFLNNSYVNTSNISVDVSQMNTSRIYISDDETNEITESTLMPFNSHTLYEKTSNIMADSNKACVSESDFVKKYQTENMKSMNEKPNLKTLSGSAETSANNWRLNGQGVIQVDGLPVNCVTSNLEEMISSFGTVSDCERKVFGDWLAIRFKLHSEDACDFAVQCLHETDCLFPDSTIKCYKVA